jgi:hypothetical protein
MVIALLGARVGARDTKDLPRVLAKGLGPRGLSARALAAGPPPPAAVLTIGQSLGLPGTYSPDAYSIAEEQRLFNPFRI